MILKIVNSSQIYNGGQN